MIYVYGNSFTSMDKENFRKIMTHFQVEGDRVQFVDLDHEDVNMEGKNFVLTVDRALIKVTRALTNAGTYKPTELLGRDVVDPGRGFHLFNIPLTINEMMGAREDKLLTKQKLDQLMKYYKDFFPIDDPIPDMTRKEVTNVEAPVPAKEEVTKAKFDSPGVAVATKSELDEVPVDVNECLNALFEHVNVADAGLGKSLSKYEKFTLTTGSGELQVYPTNRIPEKDEGLKITFKDLVTVLKVGVHLNAGTITFGAKNGTDVSE